MTPRQITTLLLAGGLSLFTSCSSHYQQLLRDRDAEIRELEGQLANARSEASEYARREADAKRRLADMQSTAATPASSDNGLAARVQKELGDQTDVRYKSGRLSIGIENTVTFSSGSTALKDSASGVLTKVADLLNRDFANRRIYVEGHTDTDPIRKTAGKYRSNRHLSLERADSVAAYLIDRCRLDPSRIAVIGFGPYDPRVQGSGDAAKSKNRRVEIVVGEAL